MQREFKFRIWDLKSKQWMEKMGVYQDGQLGDFSECFHNNAGKNGEYYIAQQFTGMKTRSGQEVYEGDIVAEKMINEMSANVESCNIGQVYFAAGTFLIDGDGPLYEYTHSLTPDILENYEVIGNIFENPELLK